MAFKIEDALTTEYADFLRYCEQSGKVFITELTNLDFVAFRSLTGTSRETISRIKHLLDTYDGTYIAEVKIVDDEKTSEVNGIITSNGIVANDVDEDISDDLLDENVIDGNTLTVIAEVAAEPAETPKERSIKLVETILDDTITLGAYFQVDPQDFDSIHIDVLNFSSRPYKRLRGSGIDNIGSLLRLRIDYIKSIKNLGSLSVEEIIQNTKEYLANSGVSFAARVVEEQKTVVSENLKNAVEAMLAGENYDEADLSETEVTYLTRCQQAIEILGEEICLSAYLDPEQTRVVCNVLSEYSTPILYVISKCEEIQKLISELSSTVRTRKIQPFLEAYEASTGETLDTLLSRSNEDSVVSNIAMWLKEELAQDKDTKMLYQAKTFLSWLYCDIKLKAENIKSQMESILAKNTRCLEVFWQRLQGLTLDEIGSVLGVTRERVRQMESRATRAFWTAYSSQKRDIIMFIYGLTGGDSTIFYEDVKAFVEEENAELIWDCIKKAGSNNYYEYSKDYHAVIIKSKGVAVSDIRVKVGQAINALPHFICKSDVEQLIHSRADEYDIPSDLLMQTFESMYKIDGIFYHSEYLSVVFMCEYVLRERFRAGYKTADEYEGKKFQKYLEEFFGTAAQGITMRAMDAKVAEVGFLCDRGKYIHPDYVNIDGFVVKRIHDYLEETTRKIIPYGEIFEALKDVFSGTEITNRYYLHGVLKKYGCKYKTGRDFVTKDSSATYVSELESFVEERGVVHKSEIMAEFTSLTEISLGQVIARCPNVFNIDEGNYIHSSLFDIKQSDYSKFREYLSVNCAEFPVNIRAVYDDFHNLFPEFMARNDLDDRNKLYAILLYMFDGEFNFSRPYIAKLGESDVTNRNVILMLIADYDAVEIDELIDICEERGINYVSSTCLCQMLAPDYFRVDAVHLMRRDLIGLTDEIMEIAENNLMELLSAKDYVTASSVTDYLWYPEIAVDWTPFLLESLIVYRKHIQIINTIGDPMKRPNSVYVTEKYSEDSFASLVVKILKPLVKDCYFTTKIEMREWLYENGFIDYGLPNFLESAKYFYVSDRGVCVTPEV